MSSTVTEAMVQQFGTNFRVLGQQRKSRLLPFTQSEGMVSGTSVSVERLGKTEAYDIISRHSDTKYADTPHSRRWIDLADKAWAELVDKMDKIRMLADPTSQYLSLGVSALNRAVDDAIITAARGNARSTTTAIPLPVTQKIAEGGTGLTIAKLQTAKEMLDVSEIDVDDDDGQGQNANRVMVVSARQLTNLLNTTEIRSTDYNSVKALVNGQVDTFLGFKFVRSERIPKIGTSRMCVTWVRGAVASAWGEELFTGIDVLPGKNYSVQVYARNSFGAARVEDEGVVEVACFE